MCFGVLWSLLSPQQWIVALFWCFYSILSKYASFFTIVATYSVNKYRFKQLFREGITVESDMLWCFVILIITQAMDRLPFFMFSFRFVKICLLLAFVATYTVKKYRLKQLFRKSTAVNSGLFWCFVILIIAPTMDRRPYLRFPFCFVKICLFCYHRSHVFCKKIPT